MISSVLDDQKKVEEEVCRRWVEKWVKGMYLKELNNRFHRSHASHNEPKEQHYKSREGGFEGGVRSTYGSNRMNSA